MYSITQTESFNLRAWDYLLVPNVPLKRNDVDFDADWEHTHRVDFWEIFGNLTPL